MERPSREYPLIPTTGRVKNQWHTMARSDKVDNLLNWDRGMGFYKCADNLTLDAFDPMSKRSALKSQCLILVLMLSHFLVPGSIWQADVCHPVS
jgi:hypothetical protein